MLETVEKRFRGIAPAADYCSLRFVLRREQWLAVRQDVPLPPGSSTDAGAMITVIRGGGLGYAATCDLSAAGLSAAAKRAAQWADATAGRCVVDFSKIAMPTPEGEYAGPETKPWQDVSARDKFDLLMAESRRLKAHEKIVDWQASLQHSSVETLLLTADGGRAHQKLSLMGPDLSATANEGALTQKRSLGGRGYCRQGGMEVLDDVGFYTAAPTLAAEAVELLEADNCSSGRMDLVLAPDQMILQIHESVGHPLELDRILGDERNYAGTSFVRPEMIGTYRYGSELMNVVYDPTLPEQFASYCFDDDGSAAERQFIVEKGILKRALGGAVSQARANLPGVANARADDWQRPPIDRMANLNLLPGESTLEDMISAVERGVFMRTNCSWSIDDSRNKFQFGCEWARLIEGGRLTKVVRNPNYRGVSATFWRNLKMVGDASTFEVLGTPNCGKGEPNQVMWVGHASPTCVFADVEVFGGE